jgi:RNA polymerase primary sigma factor
MKISNKPENYSKHDELESYFEQIRKIPLLTEDEEKELAERIKIGDESARKRLIESNLRFVIKIAKNYIHLSHSFTDLIEEGNIGLISAVDRYDGRGRFTTYAVWWIRQSIFKSLNNSGIIHIPSYENQKANKIKSYLNNGFSIEEVSNIFEINKGEIELLLIHP